MEHIDISIALKRLHKMAYEDGDLGAMYWKSIMSLLKEASELSAENTQLREENERLRAHAAVLGDKKRLMTGPTD